MTATVMLPCRAASHAHPESLEFFKPMSCEASTPLHCTVLVADDILRCYVRFHAVE